VRDRGSNKKAANSLLALSSAAVLAVYSAGYVRTRAAAERFADQTEARVRPAMALKAAPAAPARAAVEPPAATPAHDLETTPPVTVKLRSERAPRRKRTLELVAPEAPLVPVAPTPSAPIAPAAPAPDAVSAPEPPAGNVGAAPQAPAAQPLRDGTYFGWGTSRHGDIQAQVVIDGGRIASATIAQCLTRYSCSVIAKLPPQVAERQSPEVDYVSGATQSTNAFYYAVVEALSKAK
jgi:uncharacterized protein with FMN-binding domain